MSYMHIDNLYKAQDILLFRECYALEKIHGSSAHVACKDGRVLFSSGGVNREHFLALFDAEALVAKFREIGQPHVVVYGEAYGGSCQSMKKVYGDKLRFVAFEVKIGDCWLAVPQAEDVVTKLGLEFVAYSLVPTNMAALDAELAKPSARAQRNDMGEHPREGIVLRPPIEVRKNNGERIIAKYKNEAFAERTRQPKVSQEPLEVLGEANTIAEEWVTPMRLTHVLDAMGGELRIERIPEIMAAMIADIEREAAGEIVISKAARRAIGGLTVRMVKMRLQAMLSTEAG